jgi:lipopolysaccharide O-acetyltransferase
MNLLARILRRFAMVLHSAGDELPLAALVRVPSDLVRLFLDWLRAWCFGIPASAIGPGARVIGSRYISVGEGASIKRQAWIEAVSTYGEQRFFPAIRIGKRFLAFDRIHISVVDVLQIGDDCLFGSGVYISDHNHGVYAGASQSSADEAPAQRRLYSNGPVHIGHRVWLGDNVVVVGPVSIGDGAVIGANSVVTRDIPAGAMAAGAPLRILKQYNPQTQVWDAIPNSHL